MNTTQTPVALPGSALPCSALYTDDEALLEYLARLEQDERVREQSEETF